jgi:hypothetical protein
MQKEKGGLRASARHPAVDGADARIAPVRSNGNIRVASGKQAPAGALPFPPFGPIARARSDRKWELDALYDRWTGAAPHSDMPPSRVPPGRLVEPEAMSHRPHACHDGSRHTTS